jgi:predicted cupin superfamily sugar epimerase
MSDRRDGTAQDWIERLKLEPHPEGGWYRELYRSPFGVRRDGDGQSRSGLTVIVYLLEAGAISRWHRVRGSDEIWQYVAGANLQLWRLPPAGGEAEELTLGPWPAWRPGQPPAQASPVQVIAADWWQAARSHGDWSLVSCCVGPGFAFDDFDLLRNQPGGSNLPGALQPWL